MTRERGSNRLWAVWEPAMPRDPLAALVRVRRLGLDGATRELAECLRAEAEASQAVNAVQAAIGRETEAAENVGGDDADVEAFGRWLRRARQDLAAAERARDEAEAATALRRVAVRAERAALAMAEAALETRHAARRAEAQRREQAAIDEVAQRRPEQSVGGDHDR
jgi:hypothetical protein